MAPDIAARLHDLIREKTSDRRRGKELEELTGIPSESWKNVLNGKQRPTCHMIEAAAKQWPEYAFWLATGLTDPDFGHTSAADWGLHPCKNAPENKSEATKIHFELLQYLHYLIYGRSVAFDKYWIENKRPTEEEIKQAEAMANDPAWKEGMLENEIGKVFKRKYRDLNDATAELAKQRWVENQMVKFNLTGKDSHEERETLIKLIKEQEAKRRKIINGD